MKNKIITCLTVVITIAMIQVAALPPIKAEGPLKCPAGEDVQISNSYLILSVFDDTGSFNLRTTDGKLLLYPADTSNIAFQVDGVTQKSTVYGGGLNYYITQRPTITAPDTVIVKWKMSGISLAITYRLVGNNLQITATLANEDSISHQAGVRFLLDTQLGPNDGAPLYAPNIGVKTYETDMPSPTFNYWMAYDFYPNPSLQAYCTFITIPDRIAFTWWPNSFNSIWDYTVNPNQRFYTPGYTYSPYSDSAVLIYYNPVPLAPGVSKTVMFTYGLSLSIESWKYSIISALDSSQSYMYSIISSAIDNYANMMLKFNKLGVDNHIIIFKDSAEKGVFESTDWKSNINEFIFLLNIADLIKTYGSLNVLKSIDPKTLTSVPGQIGRAITDATNQYRWGWVSRDLKYSGIGIALFALDLLLGYYEGVQMENAFDILVSFNNKLASIYQSIMNSPLDLATIKNSLYSSLGDDIKNQIKSYHDESVKYVSDLTLPQGVDPNYFLSILRNINSELREVNAYQRNILIIGDSKYSLPEMNSYRVTVEKSYDAIVNAKNFALGADIVGATSTATGLVLSPSGVGGAACWIVSLVSSTASIIAETYALAKEQGLFITMFQGSQALFQILYSLPIVASKIHSIATTTLSSVIQPERGEILSINARNEWNWWNFRYDTYFDVMVDSLMAISSNGFIVFHVRSLDQNLQLADMDYKAITIPAGTCLLATLTSMVHFSFWGGNYEARFELWLGPLRVAWKTIFYNVGLGGGIRTNNVMQGTIISGQTQSAPYDSIGNTQSSMIVLNYAGSEINLHVYDLLGHHVGVDYLTGTIEVEIPGAQYSGPLPSNEWAIIPPGMYILQVVCISAEEAEEFEVVSNDLLPSHGILDISPKEIHDDVEPGTIWSTPMIFREISGQRGVSNIVVTLPNLVSTQGFEIQPFTLPTPFDLQPGETEIIDIQYSVPIETSLTTFEGTAIITAMEIDGGVREETIPIILDIVSYTDSIPPITTLTIGDPKYIDPSNNVYVTSDTPFTLSAEDNGGGSGVATTGYRIRNTTFDSGWTASSPPIEFYLTGLADGAYLIDYNSTDNAGNIEKTHTVSVILDNSGPSITIENPPPGWALQDGVTFIALSTDPSGTHSLNFSIRKANGDQGIPVGFEDSPATYNTTTGKWELFFNTLQLPDGFYIVIVSAEDNLGHIASITVPYSIRNWVVLELLPATPNNKAGRTMPVKFALRVAASVDPNQPFVYNEELTIKIYATDNPSNILQTSTFGDTARDYRINIISEQYITNFQTLKTPKTYTVEIWRKNMLIGSFNFKTVK